MLIPSAGRRRSRRGTRAGIVLQSLVIFFPYRARPKGSLRIGRAGPGRCPGCYAESVTVSGRGAAAPTVMVWPLRFITVRVRRPITVNFKFKLKMDL